MKNKKFNLTPRELDVLKLTARGYNSHQIGDELCISFNTVHVHQNSIRNKLNIHKATGLTWFALRNGIIKIRNRG